jgi:hypothetical protein
MPALSKWHIVNWRKHQPVRSAIGRQRSLIPQVVDVLDLVGVAERDSSTLQVASAERHQPGARVGAWNHVDQIEEECGKLYHWRPTSESAARCKPLQKRLK